MNGKSGESADWQNEGTVREIEGIYSLLLESTSDSIYALDGKWRYILANGATERFTGMPKEELIGKKITEVFPDIEKTKFFETFNRVMETNKAEVISDEYTFRDGRKGWYEMRVYPSPSGILCVSRDITEQKEIEKRLRASEEAARMMLNATHDMVALADFDGTIVDLNDSLAELLGRNKSEFVGRNFKDILKKEVFEVAYSCAMEVKRTKKPFHLEYEQNGRWFDNLFYPVFDEKGEVCRIADFLQDITERKKVEEALRESEEMARTLLNATHDMVLLLEWDATILDMNDAMAKSLGVNKGEAIGENLRKYLPPEIFESRHNCAVETKKTGKPARFIDERAGKYLDNIFYPIFDENGEVFRLAVFSKDITEQKEMEGKLREAVERSQTLLNATHDMVLLAKKGGIILDLNDKMAELLGGNREDIIDTPLSDHLPPEYFEERYSPAVEVEKTGKPKRIITTRDGRWFDSIYYPVFDEGGAVVGIAVFSRDITEQKKAEEELVENQKKLRTLIEATHDMVLLIHVDGTILDLNNEMAESLRMKKGELIGTDIKEYLPPDVYELRISRVRKIQRTKEPEQFVDIRKGRWFDNHFYPVFDENGEVTQIAVFTRDITEQMEAERKLRESEERFRTVVENAGEGIGVVDKDETFVFTNPEAEKIFGVDEGTLTGRNLMDFLSDEEKKKVLQQTEKRRGGEKGAYELEIVRPDGKKRIIEATVSPRFDPDGQYAGAFGVFRDITRHKAMEDEIREREERYRKLLKTMPDAVTMMDLEGNITYASKRTLEMYGFESEDNILGMNFLNFIVPEEHEKAMDNMRRTMETGFVRNVEYTLLRKDGSKFTGLLSASVIKDADGNPDAFIAVTRDITDRKKAEDEVRHLSQFRESVIDNANVWLDVLDENENVVIWNRAAENISGYSAGEVVGHGKIWEWLYPDENYRKQITEKAAAIIRRDEVVEDFETTIRCKDGEIKVISWNSRSLLGNDGKPIGSIALGRDVTARRRAEEELMKFKTVADNARYGVAIADIDGTVRYVNEYYANVHGYRVEEVVGNSVSIFYNDEQFREVMKVRERLFRGEVEGVREVWHSRRDGSVFPMMMGAVVIRGEGGKPEYLAVNALDITEYKRMEKELSQKDKMAALGRIASVVSHELNTPLANIGVTAEYLSSRLSGEYEEELKIIMSEVDNASDIIKRILNFSRMDNLELEEVDIGAVVIRAVEAVSAKRRTDAIEVEVEKCMVRGDKYRLFEVMVNIIDNAVLARDSLKEKHIIEVKSFMSDDSAVITVTDNGVGMDASVAEKSSQPFFTTRAKGEGVGLGLFIAKWIVDEHGGNLSIESEKNVGTKVTVTIPCVGGKNE